ncbi:hypothetical protein J2S89_003520 [Arthrobacter bambusae]|nr:hypothetical protein [Arthrobacter bambusae]MDQ0099889.1 hypothetical protein [Arthrobacter bambusae]
MSFGVEVASGGAVRARYFGGLHHPAGTGRAANPSSHVVEALARALRLSGEERSHLFRLAGFTTPGADTVPDRITPSVQRPLDRLSGAPVAVFDARWTLPSANSAYAALMDDPSAWSGHERNAVWRQFLGPAGRARSTDESRRALESALVADLRAAAARSRQTGESTV